MNKLQKSRELHKAEKIILALTLGCVIFTAGYFIGRSTSAGVVTVQRLGVTASPPAAGETPQASPAEANTPAAAETAIPPAVSGKLNINTATLNELDGLPGIGKVIADNIIDYREANGGFQTIDELMDVSGIGQAKFDAVKDLITTEG